MYLDDLFSAMPRQMFVSRFFGRLPFASPACAKSLVELFDWATLEELLARPREQATPSVDVLVVKRGHLVPAIAPRSLRDARVLLDAGASLVVRNAEHCSSGLRKLNSCFVDEVSGVARTQLFVTPKGERGFGWHYDAEDVFIVQTVGTKTYLFRENTVNPRPRSQPTYDFSSVRREQTPIMECTLSSGDWLYIPAGWWHVATARDDSLAISVGVLPTE